LYEGKNIFLEGREANRPYGFKGGFAHGTYLDIAY
jgi:hypothetical protein